MPFDLTNIVDISAGRDANLALQADGGVVAWPDAVFGFAGVVPGLTNAVAIAAYGGPGQGQGFAVGPEGKVITWGINQYGLGDIPNDLTNVVQVDATETHAVALKADGTVVGWGWGVLKIPQPEGLSNVISISAGNIVDTLALKADGTAIAWGGDSAPASIPLGLSNVVAIAMGGIHSLALRGDGTVVSWRLDSAPPGSLSPPAGLSNVVAIAAGHSHSLALRSDGTVVAWGTDAAGETDVPLGLTGVVQVAAGYRYSLALVGDGPPFVVTPLVDRSVVSGTTRYLRALATGVTPLSYQWRFNGADLPGATGSILGLDQIQTNQAGHYSVLVTNKLGAIQSREMNLSVIPLLISAQPLGQCLTAGSSTTLNVSVIGAGPISYQWSKDGMTIPGATNSQYVITNFQSGQAGAYKVDVSNALSRAISSTATLTFVPDYTFTTLAGRAQSPGTNDGTGNDARFNFPSGVAVDGAGAVYVSDDGNSTIRKIDPAGYVHTLAGAAGIIGTNDGVGSAARFNLPWGIVLDSATNLYIVDKGNFTVRKLAPNGTVTTLAGKAGISGHLDGTGTAAIFRDPRSLTIDPSANLYLADAGGFVRKITASGVVTTIKTSLGDLEGICIDASGDLYVCDGEARSIIKLSMPGAVASVWQQRIAVRDGGVIDPQGNIYLAACWEDQRVRVVSAGSMLSLAGLGSTTGFADGMGTNARFNGIFSGIARDGLGNLYVADIGNHTIRKGVPFGVSSLPQNQAAPVGTNIALHVAEATGTGMFYYQWLSNGVVLANQTNTSLPLGPLDRSNSGVYSVVVSNSFENTITFNATVRALVPAVIRSPQIAAGGLVRLQFQDADGGVPYDPSLVRVQWRPSLPNGTDTNWQETTVPFYVTNGFVAIDVTNTASLPSGFYRIVEQ